MRDILPQRLAPVPDRSARRWPMNCDPSVHFGRGISIDTLLTKNIALIAGMMHDDWHPSSKRFWSGNDQKIYVKVQWPDHNTQDTRYAETGIALGSTNYVNKAKLAIDVGQVVDEMMERVLANRPGEHRCWAVSTNEKLGLTRRDVYLYALHYVGGYTFQPELQVDPSRQRRLFPAIKAPTAKCPCTPAERSAATGMYVLPGHKACLKASDAKDHPAGVFPTVHCGKNGFSIYKILSTAESELAGMLHDDMDTPFRKYPQLSKIRLAIYWPDHAELTRQVVDIPVVKDGLHITKAQLARRVCEITAAVMEKCRMATPQQHCCWAIATEKEYGLTNECIYLFDLHHVGGIMFHPEFHVAPSKAPHLFPFPRCRARNEAA
ncbi:uncharacterized protein B0H18DRAFT_1212646 [Fomitopsis serialis]|uniref:uncharacterized protein n=1 Tax=Fomitopsis serialis TaxID=139415 RepID=UPI002007484E|nr:uncharacterized protein B0H18DRAFT_1212646 [Neoantrodia serialis]KAH9922417.1 hypothetical protein B0H18DRAFT_1212646 [Neoantrodia serialis]